MVTRRAFVSGSLNAVAATGLSAPALAAGAKSVGGRTVEVAYINAKVWTGTGPDMRSDAIGVAGGHIVAIGRDAVRAQCGPRTRVVDLGGAFVTPGLVDCHTHFTIGSLALSQPSLRDAPTPEAFVAKIAAAARALPKGEWLEGGNWDQDRWGGTLPTRQWIDAVTPDTPVAVIRYDLHMILCNSLALKLAGIDRNTPDVPGGVIVRDAKGEPTGIVKDAAKDLVLRAIAQPSAARLDAAVRAGIAHGLSKGVTEVHVPDLDWSTYEITHRLRTQGETNMRFYQFTPLKDWERMAGIVAQEGRGDDWVRWGACKVVFDGSLGSRTALMYLPYLDESGAQGIVVTDPKDLKAWMAGADKAGLQVTAHAIGDEANDIVLDTMAAVTTMNGKRDRRFRIEHAQHLREESIGRFARQGVIASMQPYHAIDDGRWAVRRIGPERLRTSFAVGSVVRSGAHVCFGSDWPVAPLDPLTGLYAAVMRETIDGKNPKGWYPEQRITLAQALRGYTREAAYAGKAEHLRGVIMPGMQADFAVFDRDLFAIDPETLEQAKVLRTVVGGKERFTA
ncbi:amidohydrolase [Novosphingobium sp.]|uniref:amidohydrolase n=1 Tax=Novosphingobium sp. TaxID=1874826 RepID=UPI002FDCE62C